MEERQIQLETQRESLDEDRRRWEAQQKEAASQIAAAREQDVARQADLEARDRALADRQEQWQAEREGSQRQLDEAAQELHALKADLQTAEEALEENRRRWEEEQREARALMAERAQQDAARQAELDRRERALAGCRQETETEQEVQEQLPERGDEKPPVAAVEPPRADRRRTPAGGPAISPQAAPQHGGEEESIDDYMTQLLERLRKGSGSPAPARRVEAPVPTPAPVRAAEPARAVPKEPEVADAETSPHAPTAAPRPAAVETAPHATAPETQVSMAAMRELANLSAQSAISRHNRWQMVRTKRGKLLIVLQGLIIGGALLWMWGRPGARVFILCGAVASFLTAAVWGIEYAVLTGRAIRDKFGLLTLPRDAAPAEPPAAT